MYLGFVVKQYESISIRGISSLLNHIRLGQSELFDQSLQQFLSVMVCVSHLHT